MYSRSRVDCIYLDFMWNGATLSCNSAPNTKFWLLRCRSQYLERTLWILIHMVIMKPALSNSGRELFLISLACLFHNLPIPKKFSRPNIKTSPRSHVFSAYCPMSPVCYNYKGTEGNIFRNENFQSFRH